MNVRRRSGDMSNPPVGNIANAVNQRKDAPTQAQMIKGAVSSPHPCGPGEKMKGAVSGKK